MAIIPIRNLGDAGDTDVSPYNLPLSAYSKAVNVRFDEGKCVVLQSLERYCRLSDTTLVLLSASFPQLASIPHWSLGNDYVIKEYSNGTLTDRSGSISASDDPRPFTGTTLADVTYINRPDRVPVFRAPSGTNFADLTNWTSNHRCVSLRAFGDQLIALNMTEGSSSFPNRVRFSNVVLANSIPDSWDAADTTKLAGFVDLVEQDTAIVDGLTLGSNFIIYTSTCGWLMDFVGGTFLFNFRKLFTDAGAISQNCIVEVEGKHYVFDNFDIYAHDGVSKQSICDERVKNFIFTGMNQASKNLCFVQHNPTLNEIMFCYKSGDELVAFPNAERCNRAKQYTTTERTLYCLWIYPMCLRLP